MRNVHVGAIGVAVLCGAFGLAVPVPASDTPTGGVQAPERPRIDAVTCAPKQPACPRGYTLRMEGAHLSSVRTVVFLGGRGRSDDRRARPMDATENALTVVVPGGAKTGRVRLIAPGVASSSSSAPVVAIAPRTPPLPVPLAADGPAAFPIQGSHDLGQSEANDFGGGRGHEGQDLFAACGTPLVAARPGVVQRVASQARAGNYVVVTDDTGASYVYMHMAGPASVKAGARLAAGQAVGNVGATGRAEGCQLHFELWTAPGWYLGGRPIDPLPQLQLWDAAHA